MTIQDHAGKHVIGVAGLGNMRAHELLKEFAPGSGDENRDFFLIHPDPNLRNAEKIKLSNVPSELDFRTYWNQIGDPFQKFFDNKYPLIRGTVLPPKTRLTDFEGYLYLINAELIKELKQRALKAKRDMGFNEGFPNDPNWQTAKAIAQELVTDMDDLEHIVHAGSKTGAGHRHNVASLKKSIRDLQHDLVALGYVYDPNTPDYIRKV